MQRTEKIVVAVFVASLVAVSLLSLRENSALAVQQVIRVPADYSTIQDAINAANEDCIIIVSSGVYSESVTINKSVTLLGENRKNTVIQGNGKVAVNITANRVTLNGFTILNSVGFFGVWMHSNDSIISGDTITQIPYEITIVDSHDCTISDNILSLAVHPLIGSWGIMLEQSSNNTISRNNITDSHIGLSSSGSNNLINYNLFTHNSLKDIASGSNNDRISHNIFAFSEGLSISSNYTVIHHNLFIGSSGTMSNSYHTFWNSSQQGNYWDSYTGLDNGSNNRTAGDGVGDTNIPYLGIDYYPLINPPQPIPIFWDNVVYPVAIVSNSTVSGLHFNQANRQISFHVNGILDTRGFFNLTIPKSLLRGPWVIDGGVNQGDIITENQTHTSIHHYYSSGNYSVLILGTYVVPEYSNSTLLVIMLTLALGVTLLKKKLKIKINPHCNA